MTHTYGKDNSGTVEADNWKDVSIANKNQGSPVNVIGHKRSGKILGVFVFLFLNNIPNAHQFNLAHSFIGFRPGLSDSQAKWHIRRSSRGKCSTDCSQEAQSRGMARSRDKPSKGTPHVLHPGSTS